MQIIFLFVFLSSLGLQAASEKINVKFFRQEFPSTCEAAAVRMVLNFYGIQVKENELISKMPVDSTERTDEIWGDPELGFVGYVYGKNNRVSYGLHAKPTAKWMSNWKNAESYELADLKALQQLIKDKKPVIAWIQKGKSEKVSWKTLQGKKIETYLGEHTVVVIGFSKVNGTDEIIFLDPEFGETRIKSEIFLETWNRFNRQVVTINE